MKLKYLLKSNLDEKNFNKLKKLYNFFSNSYFYHFLRYHNLFKIDYNVPDEIDFGDDITNKFIRNKMNNCNFYLEFGSGNSTLYFQNLKKNFISIETDRNFYFYLSKMILNKENYQFCDLGVVKYYSRPFTNKKKFKLIFKNYEATFLKLESSEIFPDLILVDGRFRVLTCLMLYRTLLKKKLPFNLIIDDYNNRPYYKVLENFFTFEIVGRVAFANKLIVNNKNLDELLQLYSEDPR
mgnify:CR=1 FL=1